MSVFLGLTGATLLPYFGTLEPLFFPLRFLQNETVTIDGAVFGPYPKGKVLEQLKKSGIEEVVILLNPALPQEASLIQKELQACREVGLQCRSFPLAYFPRVHSTSNYTRASRIAQHIQGRRVYVHCYLGMHRAMLVAETLEGALQADILTGRTPVPFAR